MVEEGPIAAANPASSTNGEQQAAQTAHVWSLAVSGPTQNDLILANA